MTYLAWAVLYEGTTDKQYFDVLIPRIMDELVLARGTRHATVPLQPVMDFKRGSTESVAVEICENREAFHLVFIHADTGGRNLEQGLAERSTACREAAKQLCDWPAERCILITPRHELEAWAMADGVAVCEALGYNGAPASIGLPASASAAERLVDPKAVLTEAVKRVRSARRPIDTAQLLPTIAQRQSLTELRRLAHFRSLEDAVAQALVSLGTIA